MSKKNRDRLPTLYTQSKRITPAPSVLPRLLAQSWSALHPELQSFSSSRETTLQKTGRIRHGVILTGSSLRSLPKILHCCPPQGLGPCLSPDVADLSPKSTTHHRLGEPLPHLQPLIRRLPRRKRYNLFYQGFSLSPALNRQGYSEFPRTLARYILNFLISIQSEVLTRTPLK